MADRAARESRRARKGRKLSGAQRNGGDECTTGHPTLFVMEPAFELGRMPEGGGYPVGLVEHAARLMGCDNLAAIVHLCSGSVRAPLTFDLRSDSRAAVRADVRWLPLRPSSCRWILADPPYGMDYAEELWGLGRHYPIPRVLLRECAGRARPRRPRRASAPRRPIDGTSQRQARMDELEPRRTALPSETVVPLDSLPLDVKRRYRFWDERP